MTPRGPFDLEFQNRYFNGWPNPPEAPAAIAMAFPVEGWGGSAGVLVEQHGDEVAVDVHAPTGITDRAGAQALAALSLDVDGTGWPEVGTRNALLGELQQRYRFMRPTGFHSPYEAAASFVIGHRISIVQTRRIRDRLAQEYGETVRLAGGDFAAFPLPQTVLEIQTIDGLAAAKVERLHHVAHAALDGLLDRDRLRSVDEVTALAELRTIPGIGPFFAQGILYRGVGVPTGATLDPVSLRGVQRAFGLDDPPTEGAALALTEQWQPYRMWAMVLLHVHLRETGDMPDRRGGPAR